MKDCNQTALLTAILGAIEELSSLLNGNSMIGESACYLTEGGEHAVLQPILKEANDIVTVIGYVDEHGEFVTHNVKPASPCECECEDCEK